MVISREIYAMSLIEPEKDHLVFLEAVVKAKPFMSVHSRRELMLRYHGLHHVIFYLSVCIADILPNTCYCVQLQTEAAFYKFDEFEVDRNGNEPCCNRLLDFAKNKKPAAVDVKYWGGSEFPWRNGTTDSPITDEVFIVREEQFKMASELEDVTKCENAQSLRCRGISVAFLLQMTFELDIWDWETWQVVQFIVKPATERDRCRFADLEYIKKYTGPATVFMSHCWSGKWGDLVCAACSGARQVKVLEFFDFSES